jgi:hypothetical protein
MLTRSMIVTACAACIFVALWLSALSGCKKDDKPNAITGTVTVEGGTASGVTVELFNAPDVNSDSLWAILARTPSVGFPYPIQAVFDRRRDRARMVDVQTTGADGTFRFPDRPDGEYVVVASKSGFGWTTPMLASVRGRDVTLGGLHLMPEQTITTNQVITGDVHWAARHYVLDGGLTVAAGASLTIDPGAVIRVGPEGLIRIQGTLNCQGTQDSFVVFTSREAAPLDWDWQYIEFPEGAPPPHLSYCSINYAYIGVHCLTGNAWIEHCYFANLGESNALALSGTTGGASDSIVVRHNVINHVGVGFYLRDVHTSGLSIDHNAVFDPPNYASDMINVRLGSVTCNLFYDCGRADTSGGTTGAMHLNNMHDFDISRNDFRYTWYAMSVGSRVDSSVLIHNNRYFGAKRVLFLGVDESARAASFPSFYANCIRACSSYLVYNSSCSINTHPIDAGGNYWGTNSITDIRNNMWAPQNLDPPCPPINVNPILDSCPDSEVGLCGS